MEEKNQNLPDREQDLPLSPAEAEPSLNSSAESSPLHEEPQTLPEPQTEPSPAETPEEPAPKAPSSVGQAEPAAVYRWDYTEQYLYDKNAKAHSNARGIRNFAIIMSVAFLLSLATLIGFLTVFGPGDANDSLSLNELYAECYPSYVAITTSSDTGNGVGSGIIMTEDGFIVTNQHVVEGANTIGVILHDGTTLPATYIDGDALNDIAVIKIETRGLKTAVLGLSSQVQVGDRVMAIGTPYSKDYRGTMTSGYISATNRRYAARNDNGTVEKVLTLLQTDTSVNPGNSGGPLFNMNGEVIGIVSMKIAGSSYEGMGFAIPIDGVLDMINDIISNGELTLSNGGSAVEGAALGITGQAVKENTTYLYSGNSGYVVITDESGNQIVQYVTYFGTLVPIPLEDTDTLAEYGIYDYTLYTAPKTGCRVVATSDGFDAQLHLKEGDIIMKANGMPCDSMTVLQDIVAAGRVGDSLDLEVWRDGSTISLTVKLGRSAAMKNE